MKIKELPLDRLSTYSIADYIDALSISSKKRLSEGLTEEKKKRVTEIIHGIRYFWKRYNFVIESMQDVLTLLLYIRSNYPENIGDIELLESFLHDTPLDRTKKIREERDSYKNKYEELARILNSTSQGCWLLDLDFNILNVNEAICKMLGFSWNEEKEIIGKHASDFLDPESWKFIQERRSSVLSETHRQYTLKIPVRNGKILPVKIDATTLPPDENGVRKIVAFVTDVSELKTQAEVLEKQKQQLQEQAEVLHKLSITDGLTGLHNRRHFDEKLTEYSTALKNGQIAHLSTLIIDVDNFKSINDKYGHAIGDVILKRIAGIVKAHTTGLLVDARYWGEEFVLIGPISLRNMLDIAERIRQAVELEIFSFERRFSVTVSIGVSSLSEDSEEKNPEKLLKQADDALYVAKGAGKNCVKFE